MATDKVCPDCLPMDYASAFTAVSPRCDPGLLPAPITDAVAQQFDLTSTIALVRRTFDADLRWELGPNPPATGRPPAGYQPASTVRGTLTLGDPIFYDGDPATTATYGCARQIRIPAVVDLASGDGAISSHTQGALTIVAGDFPGRWTLDTYADLSTVNGSLDLALNPSAAKRGYLRVSMIPSQAGSALGPRGEITPQVLTFSTLADALAYDPLSDVILNAEFSYPIAARWPDDGCAFDRLPIDASVPQPWLGGDSFAARLDAAKQAAGTDRPQTGQWFGGGDASGDVSIMVDIGTPQRACMGVNAGQLSFVFDTQARISTSDGRAAIAIPHGVLSLASQAGSHNVLDVSLMTTDQTPTAEFEASEGLRDIETAGSPWLRANVEAWYDWADGAPVDAEGVVQIEGAPACGMPGVTCGSAFVPEYGTYVTCLKWPSSATFSELCGRYLR